MASSAPFPCSCYAKGDTVSGTGAYACQLAKNVFHASKIITTVSTAKIAQVPSLLGEGVVDQGLSSSPVPFLITFALTAGSHRLYQGDSSKSYSTGKCGFHARYNR